MKKIPWLKWLSNLTLAVALVVGLAALVQTWLAARHLPRGACPVTNYRSWLYMAIGLCLISFVFSLLETRKKTDE